MQPFGDSCTTQDCSKKAVFMDRDGMGWCKSCSEHPISVNWGPMAPFVRCNDCTSRDACGKHAVRIEAPKDGAE